jgi:predicted hexulose-6-phosphate isomerase
MKTYQLGLYEKAMPNTLSFHQKIQLTKKHGFDFIELSIDETNEKLARLDWDDTSIDIIKETLRSEDCFIQSICLSGHRKYPLGSESKAIREASLKIMEKAIILAHKLGVRYIQIAGYDEYYLPSNEQTKAYFIEGLKQSIIMASTYGVILAFETMETPFMNTVEKAMYYVQLIDSPYLKIYPDVGNLTNAQQGQADLVTKDILSGKGHIVAGHLKETKPNIFRNLNFGEGHTNYPVCIQALADCGVRLFVGEFWYTGNEDWETRLSQASQFLRKHIERVLE